MRAPGVGVALVDQIGAVIREGFPIEGGQAAATEIAVAVADLAFGRMRCARPGLPSKTAHDLAEHLISVWREFGGPSVARGYRGASSKSSPVEMRAGALIDQPHPAAPDTSPAWERIKSDLTGLGLAIQSRDGQSPLLSAVPDFSVYEITDPTGKVIAEGKGFSDALALTSALGEAVERIIAQTPDSDRIFVASAHELAAARLATPKFETAHRDLFSPDLLLEWVEAQTLSGLPGALPAELAYYPFYPSGGIRAFSVQHTAGLAAGVTIEAATSAALRESIETDAYWLSMRSLQVCGSFDDLREIEQPRIRKLVRSLADAGIRTHAGLINFDWPLPIVHVVLETLSESLPALSHGLALAGSPVQALERALLEAVQVYSGLEKVSLQYWPEISVGLSPRADAALLWSDPTYSNRVTDMFYDAPKLDVFQASSVQDCSLSKILSWMTDHDITPWLARLGRGSGLEVVRIFLEGAVSPFSERDGPSPRIKSTLKRLGIRYPYLDPVLT